MVEKLPKISIGKRAKILLGDQVYLGRFLDLRVYDDCQIIIESNCKIDDGVRIIAANKQIVHIKMNTKIGYFSVLNGGGGISIGPNSSTYGHVYIQSSRHKIIENKFSREQFESDQIKIGENVLIGPGSFLKPGCKINNNTVIDAHSIIG